MSQQKETKKSKANYKVIAIVTGILLLLFLGIVLIVGIVLAVVLSGNKSDSGTSQGGGLFAGAEESSGSYWDESISVGDVVEFGTYEQDGNSGNGAEPIEWVVAGREGDNYYLISRYILDCQPYDDGTGQNSDASGLSHDGLVYYENSYIRKWMNEFFVPEAFGDKEMQYILPVSVKEDGITAINDNSYATDYAFIPDLAELNDKIDAGTTGTADENGYYISWSKLWMCPPTAYAKLQGCNYKTARDYLEDYNSNMGQYYGQVTEDVIGDIDGMKLITGGVEDEDYLMQGEFAMYWIRDRFYDESVAPNNSYLINSFGHARYTDMTRYEGIRPAIYVTIVNPTGSDDSAGALPEGQPAKDAMMAYSGVTYVSPDGDHYMWMDAAQIHIECWGCGITDDIHEATYHGVLHCYNGYFDIRNFTYYQIDGKDCFISEDDCFKLIYDPAEEKWMTYCNSKSAVDAAEKYGNEEDFEDGWVILFEYYENIE